MSDPGKKKWWKQPDVHALFVKEALPVAGVLLAGWDVVPLIFMYWFEVLVIYIALLIVTLVRPGLYRAALGERSWLKGGAFILYYVAFGFLFVTFLYLLTGGWVGVPVVAELLNGARGALADLSWNPLDVIRDIGRLATQEPSLGGGMIFLAGAYAVEVARILRSSASFEAGGGKVWDLYLARLWKFGLFNFLMFIVFGMAISIREVPAAASWLLALVVALKIVFDVSNHVREQAHEEKRSASLERLSRGIGLNHVRERTHEEKRAASLARMNRRIGRGPS